MKMNKAFERSLWVKIFGQPLFEDQVLRLVIKDGAPNVFLLKSKRWLRLYEDQKGFHFIQGETNVAKTSERYFLNKYQEAFKEALIEHTLLGE